MQITVIGGSGFIGSRLVARLLVAGHRVRIFDKAPSVAHPEFATLGDVRDAAAVSRALADCDCVFDLAAEHGDDVRPTSRYFDVNAGGARNIVQAAEAAGVARIVFTSSVAVYGLRQPMADETTTPQPGNSYARSKLEAEAHYRRWAAREAGRSLVLVRPCVVFGEGNRGNVHTLVEQLRRRRFVMAGRGDNCKSIAYVENVADFLQMQLHAGPGVHLFNYADKPDLSTAALVRIITEMLPARRAPAIHLPYPVALTGGYVFDAIAAITGRPTTISSARIRKFCAETTIATAELQRSGFQARYTLHEGLSRTVSSLQPESDRTC